jgi:YegS/Rv2252/BmrU family lipid kinase
MQPRFIFIVNPISGTGSKGLLQELIKEKVTKAGYSFSILSSVADNDYTFLQQLVKNESITHVIIAGGDGTVNGVVNSLRNYEVQFGIIPSGSGNGLALSAGLSKDPSAALDVVLKGKVKAIDAFTVNDRFACMLCGLGFDAQVAHDFAADPARGLKTYIKQSVKNFFIAKAYPFVLEIDENKLEVDAFFISVANSNQFGNNVTIAPQASLSDGLLDVVIVTKQNKLAFLLQTARQVTGFNKLQERHLVDKKASVIYFQTDKISINNEGYAPMHLDGEPVDTASKLNIKILKDCFKLIVP